MSVPVDRQKVRAALTDYALHGGPRGCYHDTLDTLFAAARAFANQQPASDEEIDAYLDAPLKDGGAGLKRRQFDDGLAHQISSGRHDARKAWRAAERRLGIAAPEPAKAKPGGPVSDMPGYVYVNPQWLQGSEPCVARAESTCIACDGDGSDHLHPEDPDSHPCRVCGGTGVGEP